MKIIIANQKGGAGKTTHSILFSNYLVLEKKEEILVLDMDFQSTIKMIWDEDQQNFQNQQLYEVLDINLEDSAAIMDQLKEVDGHVIIDLPGKMDDDHLVPVFSSADLVICPFAYDKKSYQATHIFAQVVKHYNPALPIVFLPNRLKAGVRYETKEQSNQELKAFGEIAPEISDKVAFQRVDTLTISSDIKDQIIKAYDFIYDRYFQKVK